LPNTTTIPTTPTQPRPGFPGGSTMFLSGKVLLSDGTRPPEPVLIERVCNSSTHPEGYTDSKGAFSINLGSNANAAFVDASSSGYDPLNPTNNAQGGNVTPRALFNCELRAVLPGFRSDTISLANRRRMDDPNVGTIVLHRIGNVQGLTISATTEMAPKDAKKAFEKGRESLHKGKIEDAAKHFEKAVEIYPKYAIAWNDLGRLWLSQGRKDEARNAFEHSIQADSHYLSPYEGVAQIAASNKNWKEVAEITDRALRLNPELPDSQYLSAVANLALHNFEAAGRSADALVKMNAAESDPRVYHVIGLVQAQRGQYESAATNLQKFIEKSPPGPPVEIAKKQLAEIQKRAAAGVPAPQP
jgi:tetratricopeptide (TPR) repeat protein